MKNHLMVFPSIFQGQIPLSYFQNKNVAALSTECTGFRRPIPKQHVSLPYMCFPSYVGLLYFCTGPRYDSVDEERTPRRPRNLPLEVWDYHAIREGVQKTGSRATSGGVCELFAHAMPANITWKIRTPPTVGVWEALKALIAPPRLQGHPLTCPFLSNMEMNPISPPGYRLQDRCIHEKASLLF